MQFSTTAIAMLVLRIGLIKKSLFAYFAAKVRKIRFADDKKKRASDEPEKDNRFQFPRKQKKVVTPLQAMMLRMAGQQAPSQDDDDEDEAEDDNNEKDNKRDDHHSSDSDYDKRDEEEENDARDAKNVGLKFHFLFFYCLH